MVKTLLRKILFALAFFIIGFPPAARADKLESAVRALATRAAPLISVNKLACVGWENHGAISDERSLALRSTFFAELGIEQAVANADTQNCAINMVLDRTPTHIVLVVTIGSGDQKRVLISEVSRSDARAGAVTRSSAQLQKKLLLQQPELILDALEIPGKPGAASSLVVLTRDAVAIFQPDPEGWKLTDSQQLPSSTVVQRDPQAELRWDAGSPDALEIVLPRQTCTASLIPNGALNCQPRTVPWRSDVLQILSCVQEPRSLQSDSKDWSESDRILLMNPMLPKDQIPLARVELPGPVLSLAPGNVPGIFAAVVFNLSTGNYEVYRITVVCAS